MLARRILAASARAVAPWWLAGGAPMPVAAYQPIGAASLADSYVNLVNPGTYDAAPGAAPTWDAANGWIFNGSTQFLIGAPLNNSFVVLTRFSNRTNNNGLWSSAGAGGGTRAYILFGAANVQYRLNTTSIISPTATSGVLGISSSGAGGTAWRNGVSDGAIGATFFAVGDTSIGAHAFFDVAAPDGYGAHYTQAHVIYPVDTNVATWIPAVSAAMAAL